jgi:ribonuclease P protein component
VQRLTSRRQFQAVLAGVTVSRTAHFAMHRALLDQCAPTAGVQALFAVPDVWLGAMVPKRWAKRAVTRNAIKRQVFEVSKTYQSRLPLAAHLVRLRSGFDRSVFKSASSDAFKAAVRAELLQLFDKACPT